MRPIDSIVKTINLKQALGEMRDTERIGGHDFPSRDCDTRYGLVLAPPRCYAPKNPQEQDASSTISGFREIEDPDTGGILLVPYKEK